MLHAVRQVRFHSPPFFRSQLNTSGRRREAAFIGFRQASTESTTPPDPADNNNMESKKQTPEQKGDVIMSESFGEGYSTRSNDEGFGGIYGGKQCFERLETDEEARNKNVINESHPDYGKSQGSEVSEKEGARHRKDVGNG